MLENEQQQVAEALRFAGTVHAAPTQEVVHVPQPQPVAVRRPRRRLTLKLFSLIVSVVAIGLILIGAADPKGVLITLGNAPNLFEVTFYFAGLVLFFGYWFLAGMYCYLRVANRQFDAARAPLPSLQEIAAHLRAEGFDPSIADCIALQNQLKREKIEHGVIAGAMFVGPTLLARQARGGPIL